MICAPFSNQRIGILKTKFSSKDPEIVIFPYKAAHRLKQLTAELNTSS